MFNRICFLLLLCLLFAPLAHAETPLPRVSASRVLVVENTNSPDAVAIAEYYVLKRKIPLTHILRLACATTEEWGMQDYKTQLLEPVRKAIATKKLDVDYILLTKGIPIRVREGGFATDSLLATLDWSLLTNRTLNPYFGSDQRFSHKKFNLYLVTRLDGYTRSDCLRLVDNALAAKPERGPFLLHTGPGHTEGGYKIVNEAMQRAHEVLSKKGLNSVFSIQESFAGGYKNLMGYFSWGSNDARYDASAYHSLGFAPGAIAETAVSTSGRTFSDPKAPGQSLIADLIAQGVSGCKGYVSEPYVDAIAHADVLFDHYTSGFNLAESFYAASYLIYWKDIVIGDPLCAPYATAPIPPKHTK